MTFWKDQLALAIVENRHKGLGSVGLWQSLSLQFPKIRYKHAGSRSSTIVIRLEDKGSWMNPMDWVNIHLCNIRERLHGDLERLSLLEGPPEVVKQLKGMFPDLPFLDCAEADRMKETLSECTRQMYAATMKNDDLEAEIKKLKKLVVELKEWKVKTTAVIRENCTSLTPRAIKDIIK